MGGNLKKSMIAIAVGLMAGCNSANEIVQVGNQAPETGGCFATDQTPAVIETRIQDVLVSPAIVDADGTITSAAVFRTETRQEIVEQRRQVRFQTPCPPVMDTEFLAALQRALKARGHYQGDINSAMDGATQAAIRSFQAENGLNSAILSSQTARRLGLIV